MADLALEVKQVFDAPIEKVWEAWTNPENMKQWMSPEGLTTPEVEVDLKEGGAYKVVMDGTPVGRATAVGKFLQVTKPTKLVYTWLWEGSPAETNTTTMDVTLNKVSDTQTEVILVHSGFADESTKNDHLEGWTSTFNKLAKFLA